MIRPPVEVHEGINWNREFYEHEEDAVERASTMTMLGGREEYEDKDGLFCVAIHLYKTKEFYQ